MNSLKRCRIKTLIFAITIFLSAFSTAYSQTKDIDSLTTALASHPTIDTARVHLLNRLSSRLQRVDAIKAKSYVDESLKLAKELGYKKGESECLWVQGSLASLDNNNLALDYFKQALAIVEEIEDHPTTCKYLLSIGNIIQRMGDLEESGRVYERMFDIASNIDDKHFSAEALYYISSNLLRQGKYPEALVKTHQAIDVATSIGDDYTLANCYSSMAIIFNHQGQSTQSLEYFLSSLRIREKQNSKQGILHCLIQIAGVKSDLNENEAALETLSRAYSIAKKLNDPRYISICLTNIGNVYNKMRRPEALLYLQQARKILDGKVALQDINILTNIGDIYTREGKLAEAELHLEQAVEKSRKIGATNAICESLIYLGRLRHAQKRYDAAIQCAREAAQLSQQINYLDVQKDSYKLLSDIYAASGNYKNALESYESYKQLNDSIFNEKNIRGIALLESDYNYEKDKRIYEIQQLSSQNQIRKQRYYIAGLVAITLLVLLCAYQLYISTKLKKKALMLEIDLANAELDHSRKKMTSATLKLVQNSERDDHCIKMLEQIAVDSKEEREQNVRSLINYYKNSSANSNWNEFELLFLKVNSDFYDKLNEKFPDLTLNERKLCVFLKLNMTSKDIIKITFQTEEALKKARLRLRKKMELDRNENLSSFIQNI